MGVRGTLLLLLSTRVLCYHSLKIKDIYSFFKKEKKRKNRLNNIKEQNDIQAVD